MASVTNQVDQLIEDVRQLVGENGGMILDKQFEVDFNSLNRLYPDQCLDRWIIEAAFELMDKPSCIRWGVAVQFHDTFRGELVQVAKPFDLWKKKIDSCQREAGNHANLIYFCPLYLKLNHWTLLEIDEQQKKIRHYDSRAKIDSIGRAGKSTMVEKTVQVCSLGTSNMACVLIGYRLNCPFWASTMKKQYVAPHPISQPDSNQSAALSPAKGYCILRPHGDTECDVEDERAGSGRLGCRSESEPCSEGALLRI